MQAIETFATIDNGGFIKMALPLKIRNKAAKIIILIEEDDDEINDAMWAKAISSNSTFDFLHDEAENIYSELDGIPYQQ
jgi:hypothetical protein